MEYLRSLLTEDLNKLVEGDTGGLVQKPIPIEDLRRELVFTHDQYLQMVDAIGRMGDDDKLRSLAFTRGIMLGARMWRIAKYHQDDTSLDWYAEISGIMRQTFGFELADLGEPPADSSLDVTPTETALPDLREVLDARQEPSEASDLPEPPRRPRGKKRKCYRCRKRGHEIEACPEEPTKEK